MLTEDFPPWNMTWTQELSATNMKNRMWNWQEEGKEIKQAGITPTSWVEH